MEKRILRLYRGGTETLKIGKALGIRTGTAQRLMIEQPRPFGVAEAAFESLTPDAFGDPHFCPKQVCAGAMYAGCQ